MRPVVMNPPSSTAFMIPPAKADHRIVMVDMQCDAPSIQNALHRCGHLPSAIAALLITHHHPDHFQVPEALDLANQGVDVYIGRESWSELRGRMERIDGLKEWVSHADALEASGRLHLLDPSGTRIIDGRTVQWASFPHGNATEDHVNIAYRVDDCAFSGDAATRHFFDISNLDAVSMFGLQGGNKVSWLALNIAQFSREDIANLNLPDHRKQNYLKNHGILEDVLELFNKVELRSFFSGLSELVIHHVRCEPLTVTALRMQASLQDAAAAQGFDFHVSLGNSERDSN